MTLSRLKLFTHSLFAAGVLLAGSPALAHDHDGGRHPGDHAHDRNVVVSGAWVTGLLASALLEDHHTTIIYAAPPYSAYGYAPYAPYGYNATPPVVVPPPTIVYPSPVTVLPPAPYGYQGYEGYGGY